MITGKNTSQTKHDWFQEKISQQWMTVCSFRIIAQFGEKAELVERYVFVQNGKGAGESLVPSLWCFFRMTVLISW